jgi:hypothetical protein
MALIKTQDKIETPIRGGCSGGKPKRWAVIRADEANDGFYNLGLGILCPFDGWNEYGHRPQWTFNNPLVQPIAGGLACRCEESPPKFQLILMGGIYSAGVIIQCAIEIPEEECWPTFFVPPPILSITGTDWGVLPNGLYVHWYHSADQALFHHPEVHLPWWRDDGLFGDGLDSWWELIGWLSSF